MYLSAEGLILVFALGIVLGMMVALGLMRPVSWR
jgi:hypothetical protein